MENEILIHTVRKRNTFTLHAAQNNVFVIRVNGDVYDAIGHDAGAKHAYAQAESFFRYYIRNHDANIPQAERCTCGTFDCGYGCLPGEAS